MLVDAHCHPYDLVQVFPECEKERRQLNVMAAASACTTEEFLYHCELSRNAIVNNAAALLPCFGIHPQLLSQKSSHRDTEARRNNSDNKAIFTDLLNILDTLAKEKQIAAIGECGFDLYSEEYKATETEQEEIFIEHIKTATKYDLPLVLHVRRAMHKIFPLIKDLAKCKAVIFHTWAGTLDEAQSLLRHGVNVYFSFGNVIMLNHKKAIQCCAQLPAERLLTETDAPYAPRRGEPFSRYADLSLILETMATLRNSNVIELEKEIENNFRKIFYSS